MEAVLQQRVKFNVNSPWFFATTSNRRISFEEMNELVLERLEAIQLSDSNNDLQMKDINVREEYSINRSFRRGSSTYAQNRRIPSSVIETVNRWKKFEQAKGCRAKLSMIETYADVEQLVPTLVQYSAMM